MQTVFIVTDSTADLPKNLISKYGITVVPLKVIFNDQTFLDGVDIETDEFYHRQVKNQEYSYTSQPAPSEFAAVYREIVGEGKSIISIHISSGLSGTVQSARIAAGMFSADIEVIDSQMVSMALGLIVLKSAQEAKKGKTKNEILSLIKDMTSRIQIFFVVDTLEYLARGGRIGKAQAFLGSLLNIKPICYIKAGIIHPYEKIRGKTKAISRLVQIIFEQVGEKPVLCSLVHSMNPAGIEILSIKAKEKLNLPEGIIISELGAVVGTHVGPGVLGIVCYPYSV